MNNINKHKVFISYYHKDDQQYKKILLEANDKYKLFEDWSVRENEIDDTGLSSERIRQIIRDEYIKDATVLILLCGNSTKHRKHIDWEIHAAMFNTDNNPKMGILVINLPSIKNQQLQRSSGDYEKQFFKSNVNWVVSSLDRIALEKEYPYMPCRIIDNFEKGDVNISVVDWDCIAEDLNGLVGLIDIAYNRRKSNKYDHSRPLRRKNT